MMRNAVLMAIVGVATSVAATEMDGKAKVIRTFDTVLSGKGEIACDDPGAWSFDVSAAVDDGRDVVTVRMTAPLEAVPPKFGVFFRMSGARVRNVWNTNYFRECFRVDPRLWWGSVSKYVSELARDAPIAVAFNETEESPVALACSETFDRLQFGLYADDSTCDMIARCEFFSGAATATNAYTAKILLDRRGKAWHETVRACAEWIAAVNRFEPADVPDAAYNALYSTWYAYLQDVHDRELEKEARLAASLGMKTMILDDGWQKVESRTFYSATGDWMPVKDRFPDMRRHVDAVHQAGLKYLLWLAVPFAGDESKAYARFRNKLLTGEKGDLGILDPRFPEVREYLISTYERVVRDWDFDGVKLDFIDSFVQPEKDPALKDGYAGRDYRSVSVATDRLMRDVYARLKAIKPDVLIEFRQRYMGPAVRQYGNMMRAADCPADPCSNRRRICDLRLTSGTTAVHSDMLVWSRDETPEGAAQPILNALFSTIQYSMILSTLPESHREVVRHWIAFSRRHREALLKGAFRPHHPENGYTWIEGESDAERIVAAYSPSVRVDLGHADRPVVLINATGAGEVTVRLAQVPRAVESFDVCGRQQPFSQKVIPGLNAVKVPSSGYVCFRW